MDLHVYRNAQDRWSDLKAAAAGRGAALATNAVTLEELVARLTPDRVTASPAQRLVLVDRSVREAKAEWTSSAVRHAVDAIAALEAARIDATDLEAAGPAAAAFAPVVKRYRELLADAGLVDYPQRCWLAAAACEAEPARSYIRQFESVVVHAIYDLNDAEFAILHNLIAVLPGGGTVMLFNATANVKATQFAEWTWQRFLGDEALAEKTLPEFFRSNGPNSALLERLFVWNEDERGKLHRPAGGGAPLRILQARGRYAEIEAIGSEIVELQKHGADLAEVAIVVRRIEAYGEILDDVFSRYGIPLAFETGVPLIRVPFIKYWIGLLDLVSGERPSPLLARTLASAYREPRLSPETDVEATLAEIGYIDRNHLAASALAARRGSPLAAELARFEGALDRLESSVWTPEKYIEVLRPRDAVLTVRDRDAWRVLAEEIRSISALTGSLPFADFRRLVSEIAGIRTVNRFSTQTAPPGVSRVRVMPPSALGLRSFRWAFAPGFSDGEIPSRVSPNPLLGDDAVELLNRRIRPRRVPTSRDRNRAEPLFFFMLLDAASEHLTLSYPSRSLEGEEILPSIYVGEVLRHYDDLTPETPEEHPPYDKGEYLRAAADAWRRGGLDEEQARVLLGEDTVRRAELERRGSARAATGQLPRGAADETVWNPSEVNTLASCPFVFLARHRLGLRVPEKPDFEIPPMEIGTLAHRILREFYATPIPASADAESAQRAETRMAEIVERHLAPIDTEGRGPRLAIDPALWRIRRPQLVRALMAWVGFAVRDARDGFETLPEYLDEPLPAARLGEFLVGGRPDHVAVRRFGDVLTGIRVDDFKYSAASSFTKSQLTQSFQIPVYAYLAARALEAEPGTPIEARYLLLRSPSSPVMARSVDELVFEETAMKIGALIDKTRRGAFEPEPADRQECATCDYRRLCRLYGS